ncbi:MAG: hypothetical protein AAFY64_02030 [Pseudomonadota bacterium]
MSPPEADELWNGATSDGRARTAPFEAVISLDTWMVDDFTQFATEIGADVGPIAPKS